MHEPSLRTLPLKKTPQEDEFPIPNQCLREVVPLGPDQEPLGPCWAVRQEDIPQGYHNGPLVIQWKGSYQTFPFSDLGRDAASVNYGSAELKEHLYISNVRFAEEDLYYWG